MARLLRLPQWSLRQPAADGGAPRGSSETEASARPEIARGQVTAFRRFRAADAEELLRWGRHTDPLLESYNMDLDSKEDALRWFHVRQSWIDSQLFAVDSLSEARVVGYIGLREINTTRRTSVLGISFDPGAMGRGYGTDSLRCFLRYYFENWKYAMMFLDVAATNFRAQRCYQACGFRIIGERWKPFTGSVRRALSSPDPIRYPEKFQLNARQPSMLFYDMRVSREEWLEWKRG